SSPPRTGLLDYSNGGTPMKALVTMIVALGLSVGFAAATLAADKMMPNTKAACEKAKMHWDATKKTCTKGSM
ncbi:MAG: hypothetical protein ACRD3W_22760, partial [Terriglobales bacterium]